ncbi:hypothetical protein MUG78_17885 [Gordonia alkaliphila]|uniref:hypothetical protein n=1 Tax=Gordonia alkaliphila TaxID=1053547 RepID=UPI001FF41CEB|nr:hypothetical protein [Gordonia alkaliphila]MCK0441273.1 hypothetical protein [Gordonia alkaliphila]
MAGLELATNGSEWVGTFGLTVGFAVADILKDGPVSGVTVVSEQQGQLQGELTDLVVNSQGKQVLILGGVEVEIEDNLTRITFD